MTPSGAAWQQNVPFPGSPVRALGRHPGDTEASSCPVGTLWAEIWDAPGFRMAGVSSIQGFRVVGTQISRDLGMQTSSYPRIRGT